MKSWDLLIFAGVMSVGTANMELYTFFKETDSKHSQQAQLNDAQLPTAAASLLQLPVGFQLQLVPTQLKSALGSSRGVLLPQQGFLPGSSLRVSDLTAAGVPNHTGHKLWARSKPETAAANGTVTEKPTTGHPVARSAVRYDPKRSGQETLNVSNDFTSPTAHSLVHIPLTKSPQPSNDLQATVNSQDQQNVLAPQTSHLSKSFLNK